MGNRFRIASSIFAVSLIVLGLTAANYRFSVQNPGGSDFVPRWLGTRLLLTEGLSPYSQDATRAIQEFYYGHVARPHQDQVLFVYPLYSIVLFAPFSLVADYPVARALWMTIQESAILVLAIVGLKLARWRPSLWSLTGVLIFALLWYHSVRPLINGNIAILSAVLIAATMWAIREEHDFAAGIFLVLASIKPQMVVLLVPLTLLWAVSQKRWRLIAAIILSFVLAVILPSLLVADWVPQNVRQVRAYPSYTLPGTPGAIFETWWPEFGRWLGWSLTIVLAGVLTRQWQNIRHSTYEGFLWTAYLTLAATNLIGVRTTTANYIALLPGLILALAMLSQKGGDAGRWMGVALLAGLFVGLWFLFVTTRSGRMQSPILFFPLPLVLLISLTLLKPPVQLAQVSLPRRPGSS